MIVTLLIVLLLWTLCAYFLVSYIKERHYAAALTTVIFAAYEFTGVTIFCLPEIESISIAQYIFSNLADSINVQNHIIIIAAIYVTYNLIYKYLSNNRHTTVKELFCKVPQHPYNNYWFLLLFLFLLGGISFFTGAGKSRAAIYSADASGLDTTNVSAAIFYGRTLLVSAVGLLVYYFENKKWKVFWLALISIIPLILELFASGRRQSFAPSAILLLMYFLYKRNYQYKRIAVISVVLITLVMMSIQFILRAEYYKASYGLTGFFSVFKPIIGELVAIGSTSFYAFNIIDYDSITNGLHIVANILNSIPYFKLGDYFVETFNIILWNKYEEVAPFGGFSMLADAFLSYYYFGYILFSICLAISLKWFHGIFVKYFENGFLLTEGGLLHISLISTILMQYRNGLSDCLKVSASLIFLYSFCYTVSIFINKFIIIGRSKRISL